MTDQIPADKVQKIVNNMRRHADHDAVRGTEEEYTLHFAALLEALLPTPPRPTLADMTPEERYACRRMLCDYAGITRDSQGRGAIGYFDHGEKKAIILTTTCGIVRRDYDRVTPRPDLPRLEWPGDEKPAPALPDGWRLADHKDHGRVIVANAIPGRDGHIHYVFSSDRYPTGLDWHHCTPDELTYIDQGDDQ